MSSSLQKSVPGEKGCGHTPSWHLPLTHLAFAGCLSCAGKVGVGGALLMKFPGFIVDSPVFGGETQAPVKAGISELGLKTVSVESQRFPQLALSTRVFSDSVFVGGVTSG